jgi:hypothetical protein
MGYNVVQSIESQLTKTTVDSQWTTQRYIPEDGTLQMKLIKIDFSI